MGAQTACGKLGLRFGRAMIAAMALTSRAKWARLLPGHWMVGSGVRQGGEGLARKLLRGLSIGAALLLAGCSSAERTVAPADQALLSDFHRVAYRTERPVLGNDGQARPRGDHLAKWEMPIRAALIGTERPDYRKAAQSHLADLGTLTGLEIAETAPAAANLLIFFADDPFDAARRHRALYADRIADPRSFDGLLARMEQSATCFGFLWGGWPSGRGIDFSVVFIRTDRGERTVQGCLVQETTQILGLMNDLNPDADSVFSDSGRQVDLTARDRLMISLLYDPRLKPGMGWKEAEPLARAALQDLQAGRPSGGG